MTKRQGRPPADEPLVPLSVRVSPKQFDETQRQASEAQMTMADWIRQMLAAGVSVNKNRP
jgi:hypothetical protein